MGNHVDEILFPGAKRNQQEISQALSDALGSDRAVRVKPQVHFVYLYSGSAAVTAQFRSFFRVSYWKRKEMRCILECSEIQNKGAVEEVVTTPK